jgi:hypothetical protein
MGHHIVDLSPSAPAQIRMAKPTADDDAQEPVFTPSDRITVPPAAIELLRNCIQSPKAGKAGNEQIRAAVAPICAEARRTNAMPEHLLVSLKELCHSLPEYESIRGARERGVFLETVVKLAIEEYYRS